MLIEKQMMVFCLFIKQVFPSDKLHSFRTNADLIAN